MTRYALLAAALAVPSASGFAPAAANPRTTAIRLVPEQGRQLVAFSQEYLSKQAKQSASKASTLTSSRRRQASDGPRSQGMTAAARGFMHRLLGDEEHKADADEVLNPVHHHSGDEILYPIVGFTLVDGHAVPTPGQQAACNLHFSKRGQEEEVLGHWASSEHGGDALWM